MIRKSTASPALRATPPPIRIARRRPRAALPATLPVPRFVAHLMSPIRRHADELLRQRTEFAQRYSDDALHRLRVAIRRLQTSAAILVRAGFAAPPDALLTRLGALRRSLGPSRDIDILLRVALPDFSASAARLPRPRARLRRRLETVRAGLHRSARQAVLDGIADTLADELHAWLATLAADAAAEPALADDPAAQRIDPRAAAALERRYRRLRKRARQLRDQHHTDAHACRVAVKKLRYTLDALAPGLPRTDVARWTTALAGLQDELGRAHDAVAGRTTIRALAVREEDRAFVKAHRQWSRACVEVRMRKAARAWRRIKALPRFWREQPA